MPPSTVFYKALVLLSAASAVLSEHQKRDVHRIIIQERVPRSHPKGHPGQDHAVDGRKRGKHPRGGRESGSDSYEDGDGFSRESSFEEVFRSLKTHKSPNKKNSRRSPRHPSNPQFEETQHHSSRRQPKTSSQNDWVPLNSDQAMQHSQENSRIRDKRNKRKDAKGARDKQKKHNMKSLHVLDLTTAYPLLHFEGSTLYPTLSWFPHILEGDLSQMTSVDHTRFDFLNAKDEDRLKNHKSDVGEADSSSDERHEIIVGKNPKMHSRKKENRSRATYFD